MPYSYNADDITAIRRPDGSYVEAVEPLGLPGVGHLLVGLGPDAELVGQVVRAVLAFDQFCDAALDRFGRDRAIPLGR